MARQVVADEAVEPEVSLVDGQRLPAGDPGPEGGGRHEADREVTTARPMVAATFPRIALVTAP